MNKSFNLNIIVSDQSLSDSKVNLPSNGDLSIKKMLVRYEAGSDDNNLRILHHDVLAVIRTFELLAQRELARTETSGASLYEKKSSLDRHLLTLEALKREIIDVVFRIE